MVDCERVKSVAAAARRVTTDEAAPLGGLHLGHAAPALREVVSRETPCDLVGCY